MRNTHPPRQGAVINTSRDALEAFLTSRRINLIRFAYVLTGDSAASEDLVQSAVIEVFRRWRTIRPAGAEAYTRRVMIRRAWRDANTRREQPTVDVELDRPAPTHDIESALDIRDAVAALPLDKRTIIVLRYWLRYTDVQIADALGCSVGTVKSRGSRAMADLKTLIDPQDTSGEPDSDTGPSATALLDRSQP